MNEHTDLAPSFNWGGRSVILDKSRDVSPLGQASP